MGALCCGMPTLIGFAILYASAPRLRRGILVAVGLGGSLLAVGLATVLYVSVRDQPVIDAVQSRDPDALRRALDAGGSARANVGIDSPCPVLFRAIESGDADSVAVLLQRGADPNESVEGLTPLQAAHGKLKVVAVLRGHGAR